MIITWSFCLVCIISALQGPSSVHRWGVVRGPVLFGLNPSACSVGKWDHAIQASLNGLKLPVSKKLSNRLQRKPGTELLILFKDSITEHMTNDLHHKRCSLGTCAPHGCYTTDQCHTCLSSDTISSLWLTPILIASFAVQGQGGSRGMLAGLTPPSWERRRGSRSHSHGVAITFLCSPPWMPELHPAPTPAPASGAASS